MSYQQVLKYLSSFVNYEKNINYSYKDALKLNRLRDFLSLIGNPQNSLRVIHIAGTKGKGSTCAFVAYILREAGFSTGLYTSPHLVDFRERIRILSPSGPSRARKQAQKFASLAMTKSFEGMISHKALVSIVEELKPVIDKYNLTCKYGPLTFFEVYTAIAFLYFKRKKVDFAVLETGMGGSLDATNAACSLVCAITPVSFEHVQKLGRSLAQIARQKAGIIKSAGIVVSAPQHKEVSKVIRCRCKKLKARLFEVGKQIKYFKSKKGFTVKGLFSSYKNLQSGLLGNHQLENASLAAGIIESLNFFGFAVSAGAVRRGISDTIWPARCEIIQKRPLIVLDGAQNLASALALKKAIMENFYGKYKKLILVLGISDDKDVGAISGTLEPLADIIILTRADTARAMVPEKIAKNFRRKVYLTQSVKAAKILAESSAGPGDLILVTGSLFVAGEFRKIVQR